ncbi:vanadium-dependent haloperoxidase [Marinicella sediminis]|uniref:Vanadium-dependent haloperoxidase n=1 Tax=Marinicella sediminis TaxID=1792834 RepID=A0ABV7JBT9_9GAMM|nr:vanadium-dependent haloperoxidase [Marinicella sediminis]
MKKIILLLLSLFTTEISLAAVARDWNEVLLDAIREDQARPTVHARNLYHVSAAMYDAWCVYDSQCDGVFYQQKHTPETNLNDDRAESISYATYRLLLWRFSPSVGADVSIPAINTHMTTLGYDPNVTTQQGDSPAAIGNRIAQLIIDQGLTDGTNELNDYENQFYEPVNEPLLPDFPGNPDITDPNRWQPLALEYFKDQSGIIIGEYPDFLSPEWGQVDTFSLRAADATDYQRDGFPYRVYKDPGAPPYIGGTGDADYKAGFEQVVLFSGLLDPADGVMIDISPASRGNNDLGTNNGAGYDLNPITGLPYQPEWVPAGDYYRVLAEFWADGPDSETPPGHWFTILNTVSDHPLLEKRFKGQGPLLDDLEWEVKSYLALGGTMHDAAVAAWSVKGWYDYIRPVSAIRYMCDQGQSSDPNAASYNPNGIGLYPGQVELITPVTIQPGGIHQHLAGLGNENLGKIAVNAWRGPDYIIDPDITVAGVGWILCENWWPYQRPSFVSPPFAGYVSGHSVFSRAAAEVMTLLTGSAFFPGGMSDFFAPQNEFLVFEDGPSVDITLQWATYQDAADETSISRIYGGIHPTADDIPGRFMGYDIGHQGFALAEAYFAGLVRGSMIPVPVNQWPALLFLLLCMTCSAFVISHRNKHS